MSGRQEKRARVISIPARREQQEFERLALKALEAAHEKALARIQAARLQRLQLAAVLTLIAIALLLGAVVAL
jgi:hypothetical protein